MRTRALLIGLVIAAAACGRSTLRLPSVASTTGSGGDASTVSGGDASTVASTTADVSASSSGGGLMCGVEPDDTVQITLQPFQGMAVGCATGTAVPGVTEQSIFGEVTAVSEGTITIDSCPPNADCPGQFSNLTISAPGFHPYLPFSAYVEVRIREHVTDTCVDTVMVRNLPSWEGAPNPVSTGEGMWLSASSGKEAFEDAPYQIEPISEGCSLEQPPVLCGKREDYFFRVSIEGSPFDVGMGMFSEVGSPPQWIFRNLQSYTSGLCNDVPHFAYWFEVPILD